MKIVVPLFSPFSFNCPDDHKGDKENRGDKVHRSDHHGVLPRRQEKTDDEIHVGDEVIFNGKKYIAVYKTKFEGNVIIENNTDALATRAENVKKTGRKYPVAEMLEGLKNDGE